MRSSEAAAAAGVNVQTLRYYERRGLLPEPARRPSGYRAYDPDAVRTVRFVKRAQHLGFTLGEIDVLLDLAAGGPDSCDAVRALATEKVTQLDEKILSLAAMRESLAKLVESCQLPRSERSCPLLDAVGGAALSRRS
ncbi:MAG: MerR family transcriptional regulator [Candidatus Dormibacteria bacterium]